MNFNWKVIRFLIVGIMTTAFLAGCRSGEVRQAADLVLKDVNGVEHSYAELKGVVTIVDFWATWCAPCKAEMPHFEELYQQYQAHGLQIIGISVDGSAEDVKRFLKEDAQVSYPILMATEPVKKAFGGIEGLPTTFVIDQKGVVYQKYIGFVDKETFEKDIKTLLDQKI